MMFRDAFVSQRESENLPMPDGMEDSSNEDGSEQVIEKSITQRQSIPMEYEDTEKNENVFLLIIPVPPL
jgi:hypothetical protein